MADAAPAAGGHAMDFKGDHQHSSYAVEVSGWDLNGAFFVEKTDLKWTAGGIKEISLRQPVREGALIFVRLMQPFSDTDNYPIACQVAKVTESSPSGRAGIQLTQRQPRAFYGDTPREMKYSRVKVA
jgi:hypothetical protein